MRTWRDLLHACRARCRRDRNQTFLRAACCWRRGRECGRCDEGKLEHALHAPDPADAATLVLPERRLTRAASESCAAKKDGGRAANLRKSSSQRKLPHVLRAGGE